MAQPYDYSLNIPSPLDAFSQGFNVAAAGQQARQAREDRAAAIENRKLGEALVTSYLETPREERTHDQLLQIARYDPQIAQLAQQQFDSLSEQQQANAFLDATQAYSALNNVINGSSGPEVLDQYFDRRVEATKGNVGLNKMWLDARELARTNPEAAEIMVGARIAALPGGKEFFETMSKRSSDARAEALQPGKMSEQRLQVKKLQDEIKFNELEGFQTMAEAGVDILSLVAEDSEILGPLEQIAKKQRMLDAAMKRKDEATIENLQLQIQERKDIVQEKAQAKIQEQKVQLLASDDLYKKSTEILDAALEKDKNGNYKKDEKGNYIVTSTAKAALGPLDQLIFTAQSDVADFEEDVGVLAAQIYLDKVQLMRGTGPLSDREGAMLQSAAESLSLRQSAQKFIKNVMSIRNLSLRSQELTKEKYGDFSGILEARASGELSESPDVAETFKVETPLGTYFFDSEEAND